MTPLARLFQSGAFKLGYVQKSTYFLFLVQTLLGREDGLAVSRSLLDEWLMRAENRPTTIANKRNSP
jgi:hypothetical protein